MHTAPLPEKMRPQSFQDLVGQEKIWGPGRPLQCLAENDAFTSLILWGPPGTGKTSLALMIAASNQREMVPMSAVRDGVKNIREQIQRSTIRVNHGEQSLLIFMDEIHRLNKAQQDVLLPALEQGTIKFIGATTENPSFEVNHAIISRSMVFPLNRLEEDALKKIIKRSMEDEHSPHHKRQIDQDVTAALIQAADGDGRRVLNLLDSILSSVNDELVTLESARPFLQGILRNYDKKADNHYDIVSALIKSIRASQADAACYYLARMIDGGEDPMFIARRLVIAASEDIGNANPTGLLMAQAGLQAVHQIGLPEARIILSQVATYLAASPKSNRSYLAINQALQDVERTGSLEVPLHLRNAPTKLMKSMGYGDGYIYAHDNPKGAAEQEYLPQKLKGRKYYEPSEIGTEKVLKQNLDRYQNP